MSSQDSVWFWTQLPSVVILVRGVNEGPRRSATLFYDPQLSWSDALFDISQHDNAIRKSDAILRLRTAYTLNSEVCHPRCVYMY